MTVGNREFVAQNIEKKNVSRKKNTCFNVRQNKNDKKRNKEAKTFRQQKPLLSPTDVLDPYRVEVGGHGDDGALDLGVSAHESLRVSNQHPIYLVIQNVVDCYGKSIYC